MDSLLGMNSKRMDALTADLPNRERKPTVGLRPLLICLPVAWAFMLNDITSVESNRFSSVGMSTDATLLSLTPIPLLVLWIACFQFWLSTRQSVIGWTVRLAALWIVSIGIFNGTWLFAFRNTDEVRFSQMPEPDEIRKIERETGLKLSWMSRGNDCSVLFDNRAPNTQNQLQDALFEWREESARKQSDRDQAADQPI